MSANHELAQLDYETGMKYKEIAEKYDVSINTVKSWKQRHNWTKDKGASPKKSVHTKSKRVHTKKESAQPPPVLEVMNEELTDKQRFFVLEYMRDFNATRAAMAVGYSKKTAYSIGWELLRKPEIQAEVKRLTEMMVGGLGLGVQRIIAEYMKIAFADITDYAEFGQADVPIITKKGPILDPETGEVMTMKESFVAFKDHAEIDGTVISEVKQGRDGVSIKLHDKMRALKELEKYTGYMTDEDKLRVQKLQAEVNNLNGDGDSDENLIDDWVEAVLDDEAEQ
jgi:phage terminase small subunit